MLPLIFAAAASVAGFTAAWQIQGQRYEQQLSNIRADQATALAKANADALAETQRIQAAANKALKAAAARQSTLTRDLAANRDALGRLHDASDGALRRANDSHSACQRVVTTYADIQQQCSSRLVEVGAAADRAISEAVMLREAWPTASPQSRQQ